MTFELKDVLGVGGPSASLIFAATIYLGFLQQRYTSTYDRYRDLADGLRTFPASGDPRARVRRDSMAGQLQLYRRRCGQLMVATNFAVAAAVLLSLALVVGLLNLTVAPAAPLKYACLAGLLAGLLLLVVSSAFVVVENTLVRHAVAAELDDLGDPGPESGDRDPRRRASIG